ncbi:MAG: hypothetical protein LBE44_00910 [Microbacterium hominis]|nr:hypothetical protein [Microbacterium hominis]
MLLVLVSKAASPDQVLVVLVLLGEPRLRLCVFFLNLTLALATGRVAFLGSDVPGASTSMRDWQVFAVVEGAGAGPRTRTGGSEVGGGFGRLGTVTDARARHVAGSACAAPGEYQ